jgi:hypothetical protein
MHHALHRQLAAKTTRRLAPEELAAQAAANLATHKFLDEKTTYCKSARVRVKELCNWAVQIIRLTTYPLQCAIAMLQVNSFPPDMP